MDYRIGDIAQRSGLTVRALHHYDQLGLLRPSGRSEAGYRLYSEADILTLHRILAYQQMGLALKDIAPLLGPDAPPLQALLARQIAAAQAELLRQQNLLALLQRVARRAEDGSPANSEQLLSLMAMQRNYARHFSEAELQQMREAQGRLGDAGMARLRTGWDTLVPAMRAQLEAGASPLSPAVQALARRWIALGDGLPDDEALRRKGREMFARQPHLLEGTGLTLPLLDFLDAAVAAAKARAGTRTRARATAGATTRPATRKETPE